LGLRKAYFLRQIGDLTVSATTCLHLLSLQYGGQNRWKCRNYVSVNLHWKCVRDLRGQGH